MTRVVAIGHYLPERRVLNAEIEARLNKPAGWIEQRTGIRERRYAAPGQAVSDLALAAAHAALSKAEGVFPPISLVLLATSTPDHLLPPTAPLLVHLLRLENCGGIDLAGACCGFIQGLALADGFCQTQGRSVLLVAGNVLSTRIDPRDAATASLFADAAAALLLAPTALGPGCLNGVILASRGDAHERIQIPAGGSRDPFAADTFRDGRHRIRMARGPAVFHAAVDAMVDVGRRSLAKSRTTIEQIDFWIPHQANGRLIDQAGDRLGVPFERRIKVIEETGNSSATTIPLALSLAAADGRLRKGMRLLLTAVGAGMCEAGAILDW